MKDRYLVLISLGLVILQTTILQLIRIKEIMPNILLIWLIIAIVLFGRLVGIKVALYLGVFTDVLIGKGLAVNLTIYLIVAIVISLIEEKIFKDNYITPVVLIVLTTVFYHVFYGVVHYFSTGQFLLMARIFTVALPEVIYNLIVGVALYVMSFKLYMGYQMR